MKRFTKKIRKHLKTQKQILKLSYQKGLLHKCKINLKTCYWSEDGYGYGYKWQQSACFVTGWWDSYSNEGDADSVIDRVKEYLWWEYSVDSDEGYEFYPLPTTSLFNRNMSDKKFIYFLKKLPTIINDNKINKKLKYIPNDFF